MPGTMITAAGSSFSRPAICWRPKKQNITDPQSLNAYSYSDDNPVTIALYKKRPANLRNRLHDQHPNLGSHESWKPMWTPLFRGPDWSRSPRKGGPFCMPIRTIADLGCERLRAAKNSRAWTDC